MPARTRSNPLVSTPFRNGRINCSAQPRPSLCGRPGTTHFGRIVRTVAVEGAMFAIPGGIVAKTAVWGSRGVQAWRATRAARAAADAAAAEGRRGAATALVRGFRRPISGTSTRGGDFAVSEEVTAMYEAVPPPLRVGTHLKCGEVTCLTRAIAQGQKLRGSTIVTVRVGGRSHGEIMPPCDSCAEVVKGAGLRVVGK